MEIIVFIVIIVFSVVLHEFSHAAVANALGDPTAKNAGRLTLNPIPHIDPIGTIILPIILFLLPGRGFIAWAKPVPINPYNFRDLKFGELKTSFAGPGANIAIAVVFGIILRFFLSVDYGDALVPIFRDIVLLNLILAFFNLVPIPPLDGSHVLFTFLSSRYDHIKRFLMQYGFFILIGLVFLFPGVFFPLLFVPINFVFSLVVGTHPFALQGVFL